MYGDLGYVYEQELRMPARSVRHLPDLDEQDSRRPRREGDPVEMGIWLGDRKAYMRQRGARLRGAPMRAPRKD